jgi:hypothetical protein
MQSFMGFMSNINIFVCEREDFNVIVKSAFNIFPQARVGPKTRAIL